jgi:hypothetical protein
VSESVLLIHSNTKGSFVEKSYGTIEGKILLQNIHQSYQQKVVKMGKKRSKKTRNEGTQLKW